MRKTKTNNTKRPPIPDDVKLKLWVLSGGRCEIPGCNDYVWRDKLTLKEDNFAHMAHIVGASDKGPRGDQILSPKMAKDFDNLMLVCLKHSKLIDGKNKAGYTVEYLKQCKKDHEDRIRRQTSLQPEATTTVLLFMANIGDRPVSINLNDAYQAIFPRYPANDRGININLTTRPGRGKDAFWQSASEEIVAKVEKELADGNDRQRPTHLSVFALAPMPLLIKLGYAIGSTISSDLFQKHRDTDDWKWKADTGEYFQYHLKENIVADSKDIAMVLSLSGKIHTSDVMKVFMQEPHIYEMSIDDPTPGFLSQQSRLNNFRIIYRELLSKIRERHGPDANIHLFPAVPAPIAVLCGRELLPKVDPSMTVYDFEKEQGGFIKILNVN